MPKAMPVSGRVSHITSRPNVTNSSQHDTSVPTLTGSGQRGTSPSVTRRLVPTRIASAPKHDPAGLSQVRRSSRKANSPNRAFPQENPTIAYTTKAVAR